MKLLRRQLLHLAACAAALPTVSRAAIATQKNWTTDGRNGSVSTDRDRLRRVRFCFDRFLIAAPPRAGEGPEMTSSRGAAA
jgi:hypothetical protein